MTFFSWANMAELGWDPLPKSLLVTFRSAFNISECV